MLWLDEVFENDLLQYGRSFIPAAVLHCCTRDTVRVPPPPHMRRCT